MWSPGWRTQTVWKSEIVGRLCLLKERHERASREIPGWDSLGKELSEAIGEWERDVLKCPGPLEGHCMPSKSVPVGLAERLEGMWTENPDDALLGLSNICLGLVVSKTVLERAREVVRTLAHDVSDSCFESLENASNVAARSRDIDLAREIGGVTVGMAPKVESGENVLRLLLIVLTSAAAHAEQDAWAKWLDDTLTRVASSLPSTPSDCLHAFHEYLDQFNSVVAMDSWFHVRANAIASSGS